MHKIISTTGEPIEFSITSDRKILIDNVESIEVSSEEFEIIQSRLGSQISVTDSENTEEVVPEETSNESEDESDTDTEEVVPEETSNESEDESDTDTEEVVPEV